MRFWTPIKSEACSLGSRRASRARLRQIQCSCCGSLAAADAQTQTLRARVSRGADQLRPGEVVQARVPFAAGTGWGLPLAAVTYQDDKAYVFVRSTKGFVATPVIVLSSAGQAVQVRGTLQSGQEVAVSSVIALKSAWLGKGGGE